MKKVFFLTLVFSAIITGTVNAQTAGGPAAATPKETKAPDAGDAAAMLQKMKDMFKAPMIEKTGLTEAQVDRVIEINLEMRLSAANRLRDLNEADRSAKLAEMKAEKEKKFSEIPLTAEQIKSVYAFYEEMGKNMQKRTN